MKYKGDSDTNCNWSTSKIHQRISKGSEGLEDKRMSGDYSIIMIEQNTKKNPGDWTRLEEIFRHSNSN